MLHIVGQFCFYALVEICSVNTFSEYYPCFSYIFHFVACLFIIFSFCFSCSGWGIGPSGGIVEPDLVVKMRFDEGSDGDFFYGPSLSLYREPFVNERYLLGDGRYHNCGPYLDMEKKFFS